MTVTIEVYIKNKEIVLAQTTLEGRPLAAGGAVHHCTVKEVSKIEKIMSEDEKATLQLVKALAAEKGLKVQIIDVASFKGKIKAKLKGVKITPTIIFRNKRIVGPPRKEELEAIIF